MADLAEEASQVRDIVLKATFQFGTEDQLKKLRSECEKAPETDEERKRLIDSWHNFLRDTKVKMGTLLKTDHLNFLFGAGVSKDAGGVLLGKIPLEVEKALLTAGAPGTRIRSWINIFYVAARRLSPTAKDIPTNRTEILQRRDVVESTLKDKDETARSAAQLAVGFEDLMSLLYRWNEVLADTDTRLRIDGALPVAATKRRIEDCLTQTKISFAACCSLPRKDVQGDALSPFNTFLKKALTRPLNLRRTALFTLNYDLLLEKAADANGIVLLDGFVGRERHVFHPESYDHDFYFPGDTTEGRVHRLDRVIHLYKLHGSINWISEDPTWDNPYGVSMQDNPQDTSRILIYPTPAKYGETLGMPYAELFRRFAASVVRPQSTLIVIGYGFGDPHVNTIIRQALLIPSFTLVVVEPYPPDADANSQKFVAKLRARPDGRLWLLGGSTFGTFAGFVEHILPDLHDQEVMSKVIETYRALGHRSELPSEAEDEHAK